MATTPSPSTSVQCAAVPYSFQERLGIFINVLGGSLCVACSFSILSYAMFKVLRRRVRLLSAWFSGDTDSISGERISDPIPNQTFDATDSPLFINLMFFEMIQGIGALPGIRWMNDAKITSGSLCTAQAVLKNVGRVGVAWTSFAIALHGFAVIALDWNPKPRSVTAFLLAVWLSVCFITIIPSAAVDTAKLYGPSAYWCWITTDYRIIQMFAQYFWVWLAGGFMIVFYGIQFLVLRKWLVPDRGRLRWHNSPRGRFLLGHDVNGVEPDDLLSEEDKKTRAIADLMLYYPAAYILCILPTSIARWFPMNQCLPFQFVLFANTIYTSSGTLNTVLYLTIRPGMMRESKPLTLDSSNSDSSRIEKPLPRRRQGAPRPTSGNPPPRSPRNPGHTTNGFGRGLGRRSPSLDSFDSLRLPEGGNRRQVSAASNGRQGHIPDFWDPLAGPQPPRHQSGDEQRDSYFSSTGGQPSPVLVDGNVLDNRQRNSKHGTQPNHDAGWNRGRSGTNGSGRGRGGSLSGSRDARRKDSLGSLSDADSFDNRPLPAR